MGTFLGKNYLTKYILVHNQFQKTKICWSNLVCSKILRKQFQKSTLCIFSVLMGILILITNLVDFCTPKNPDWIGINENSYLSKILSEKTANSKRFELSKI